MIEKIVIKKKIKSSLISIYFIISFLIIITDFAVIICLLLYQDGVAENAVEK